LLAELAGHRGRVIGWDVEAELAALAHRNLARWTNASAECRSGTEPPIPDCDLIYVSAGCSDLPRLWCDALADGGRLVFPLTPVRGVGGMLKLTRRNAAFRAEFIARCQFIPCVGADSPIFSTRLAAAFARGDSDRVRSLRFGSPQSESCWYAGNGWWLATE
jgi:protein-L-isoaspartate(D-aspartate) O-methyltransferase